MQRDGSKEVERRGVLLHGGQVRSSQIPSLLGLWPRLLYILSYSVRFSSVKWTVEELWERAPLVQLLIMQGLVRVK